MRNTDLDGHRFLYVIVGTRSVMIVYTGDIIKIE